jgi:hypothetical protein
VKLLLRENTKRYLPVYLYGPPAAAPQRYDCTHEGGNA